MNNLHTRLTSGSVPPAGAMAAIQAVLAAALGEDESNE